MPAAFQQAHCLLPALLPGFHPNSTQDSIPDPSSAHCTGAVCGAHLRVVAADRAAAFGGAAGVALAGVREGVVLLLLVPRFHHVYDRAGPAKGAAGKVDLLHLRAHARWRERGRLHFEEWGEKGLEQGPFRTKHYWGEGGNDILVPSLLVELVETQPSLQAPECSASWWRSGTCIPLVLVPGRQGIDAILPDEQ